MYEMARFLTNFKQIYFAVLPYKYVTAIQNIYLCQRFTGY